MINPAPETGSYAPPLVITGYPPSPPAGLKQATDPPGIDYPGIQWGGYTYWPFSYIDNRVALCIVAYDGSGASVGQWPAPSARYIARITVDAKRGTVNFTGQADQTVFMEWEQLLVSPVVVARHSNQVPQILQGLPAPSGPIYPVLEWSGYSYWPYGGVEQMVVVAFDSNGSVAQLWQNNPVGPIQAINVDPANLNVTFIGTEGSVSQSWNSLSIAYSWCYKATAMDVMAVAEHFDLPITIGEAIQLAAALPTFSCANCSTQGGQATVQLGSGFASDRSVGTAIQMAVGAVIGGLIGTAAGAVLAGPGGAGMGLLIGSAVGADIGRKIDLTQAAYHYTPSALERETYLHIPNFPFGPLANTGIYENLFDLPFPRYGGIAYAGALAEPGTDHTVTMYYPTLGRFSAPNLTKYPPLSTRRGKIYKFIFVIVKVIDLRDPAIPAYQLRMHPDDFYPSALNSNERINHSELSDGWRFAALLGLESMQVYAAGTLYLLNNQFVGIDSRTGHYFWSFAGRDQDDINAALLFIGNIGYRTDAILQWASLRDVLNDMI